MPELGYLNLGNAYFRLKQYRKARGAWELALKLDPDNKVASQNIEDLKKAGF